MAVAEAGMNCLWTLLPCNRLHNLHVSNMGQNKQYSISDQQQIAKVMLKNHQFLNLPDNPLLIPFPLTKKKIPQGIILQIQKEIGVFLASS